MAKKVRLDRWLVQRGLAPSRHRAVELIEAGRVLVSGVPVTKAAAQVDIDMDVRLEQDDGGWVGRGALKLLGVLEPFGVDPAGRICADLGASTGGFTEVLLRAGAARVYAIDVGRGLLHERLRTDPRVIVIEDTNVRHLGSLPDPIALLTADLSFISITKVIPVFRTLLAPGGEAIVLVKPQFEVGQKHVGAKGRVRDEGARQEAIDAVARACVEHGLVVRGSMDSPLPGARSGNIERFLHLVLH